MKELTKSDIILLEVAHLAIDSGTYETCVQIWKAFKKGLKYAQIMSEEVEEEPEVCPNCNGSGEGMHDGTKCSVCKGTGVEK